MTDEMDAQAEFWDHFPRIVNSYQDRESKEVRLEHLYAMRDQLYEHLPFGGIEQKLLLSLLREHELPKLEWDLHIDRRARYNFSESLQHIRERGFDRHPRPNEFYSLVMEQEFQGHPQDLSDFVMELTPTPNIWLSMAAEVEGNTLHTYLDPENLIFDDYTCKTVGPEIDCSRARSYTLPQSMIDDDCWSFAKDLPLELQQDLFLSTHPFFPRVMRTDLSVNFRLDGLHPICTYGRYGISYGGGNVSIGVREVS